MRHVRRARRVRVQTMYRACAGSCRADFLQEVLDIMLKQCTWIKLALIFGSLPLLSCAREPLDQGEPGLGQNGIHPVNANPIVACTRCHKRPESVQFPIPATSPSPGHFDSQACSECHETLSVVPEFVFTHRNTPGNFGETCLPCHEARRPPNHNQGRDCAECHHDSKTEWASSGASPHPNSNAELTTCSRCHSSQRPSGIVNRFNHSIGGTGDCAACHKQPGVTWSGGVYNHTPTPSSCSGCHSSDRPTAIVNGFNHATSGTGDCASCHRQPGIAWAGAIFPHSPMPTTCVGCHASDRPSLDQSYPTSRGNFRHGQGNHKNFDCVRCHSQPGVSWGSATPGNICNACHSGSGNVDD
ncbi:MAG TPA: hypothetical protein DCS07_02765 [Bdellovibrionales bacterium]|nr:hypothetical protein [Bdellovibrionales bacterium]HCM39131.1 hypothetical protein [Bdellovibrionales bacterium]